MEGLEGLIMPLQKKKYIIFAATNGKSAGQRVLYQLREKLEDSGFDAKILCYGKPIGDKSIFVHDIKDYDKDKDIVVYPEIIEGNPLKFRNVVRYILQDPEFWGMSKEYDNRELIFTFDNSFYKNVPVLKFDTIDRSLFYDAHLPKDVNCYFVYKKGKFREVPEIEGWTEINMHWPEKREDLANLLQRTENLYSFDSCSVLVDEAVLCGAKVKIITPDGFQDYKETFHFNEDAFKQQFKFFIETTQNMNSSSDINYQGTFSCIDWLLNRAYRLIIRILYIVSRSKYLKNILKNNKLRKHCGCVFSFKRKNINV